MTILMLGHILLYSITERNGYKYMKGKKIGFAMCGSFCTLSFAVEQLSALKETGARLFPIMSEIVYNTDTRFGSAESFKAKIEAICQNEIIHEIKNAEPIGPKQLLDLLIIAPCTGNTLGKLANGITDTCVTLAAKAHLRNEKPVLLAVSTNDALSASAKNIGQLLNVKNIFLVPFGQDLPQKKYRSCVADFSKIIPAAKSALKNEQLQPILL